MATNRSINRNGTRNAERVLKREVAWYNDAKDRIIAVDFGTSTLAAAWLAKQDGVVKELTLSETSRYIPTVLLMKNDGRGKWVVKIGEKALIDYYKVISDPSGDSQVIFFEKIKMELQHDQSIHRSSTITASNGKQYYLLEVISLMLSKVKERVQTILSRSGLDINTFSWVLTVPALWGESARKMMKDSANLAGYCGDSVEDRIPLPLLPAVEHKLPNTWETANPDRVSLVFEPEAAAAWCMELDRDNVRDKTDFTASLRTDGCFLTADIGGGTIDITAHQVLEDGRMLFFRLPSGQVHGGAGVNEDFISFLEEVTECRISSYYSNGSYIERIQKRAEIQLLKNKWFEEAKKQFAEADDDDDCNFCQVSLPKNYCQMYQTILNEKSSKNKDLFFFADDANQLRLKEAQMVKLMSKYLGHITSCIQSSIDYLAKNGQYPKIIYLVGGFGGSNYVVNHVKRIFKRIRVIIPQFHELAVVKGACLYYRNKAIRIADATYGTECKIHFDPNNEVHKEGEIVEGNDGEMFCKALFKPFVRVGDQLDPDYVYKTMYSPIREDQNNLLLTLYSTRKDSMDFIEQRGNLCSELQKLAVIFVNLEELRQVPFEERLIQVLVDFSSVEITVCAYYESNGKEVRLKSSTEFLSTLEQLKSIENNDNIVDMMH